MFVKHYAPEAFFITDVLYNWISQFKVVVQMYEEEIHFGKLLLKQSEIVLAHLIPVTLTFNLVTPKSKCFLCYLGWMCGPSLRKEGRHSQVIDWKRIGYRRTYRQTYQPTCAQQYALSSSKGGIIKLHSHMLVN